MSVNITDYSNFLYNYVQIPTSALPTNSPSILMTLAIAEDIVNPDLMSVTSPSGSKLGYTGSSIYELAVYNLATDFLINFCQDQTGQTYFANLRTNFGINNFVAGVITSSGNDVTNESILNPEIMKGLTFANLQNLKTPYGRQYLAFAGQYGILWGLT